MATFQLWSRDEYGQGSILHTTDDVDDLIKQAKQNITDINVNNALTTDDRERNWEAYMVNVSSGKKSNNMYLYGEKDIIYKIDKAGEVEKIAINDVPDAQIKFYLGNVSTKRNEEDSWFAKDPRQRPIESIDHQDLEGKTSFFVKVV